MPGESIFQFKVGPRSVWDCILRVGLRILRVGPRCARDLRARDLRPEGLLFLAAALAGCAHGGIRDGVYHAPKERYEVRLPPGTWDRLEVDGADLAITSADRSMSILTGTLCGRYSRAKLETLSQSLFVGLRGRRVRADGPVTLPAGAAHRIAVEGRSNGTAIAAEAYTFRRSRCLFDFVYLAAPERFDAGVEAFRAMVRTLRLPPEGGK